MMPANRSWLLWTSILALAIGVVLGTWLVPSWRAGGRINAVASSDFPGAGGCLELVEGPCG